MSRKKIEKFTAVEIAMDWSEMDQYQHINNVMIMKYVQTARVHFWEKIGIGSGISDEGFGANLASTSCDFKLPLFYPGKVIIQTQVNFIKNTSFGLHHKLFNANGELVAEASDVVVLYNYREMKKRLISEALRKKLGQFSEEKN